MVSSFRKPSTFGLLRVPAPGNPVAPAGAPRGVRVPVGLRGIYVSFGPHGVSYQSKVDGAALVSIRPEAAVAVAQSCLAKTNGFKVYVWCSGVVLLLGLAVPPLFVVLGLVVVVLGLFVRRWDHDRRVARIFFDVDSDELVARLALCGAVGDALARAARLWHVGSANQAADATVPARANGLVGRSPTRPVSAPLEGIDLNVAVWSVPVGERQLLLLPDRLLVRTGAILAAVPYETLTATHTTRRFVEHGDVPPDARVVDTTWRFANKSGGPDRRYKDNRQIPVVEYGELALLDANGQAIVLQASSPLATQRAAAALQELARRARTPAPPALRQAPSPSRPAAVPAQDQPAHRAAPRIAGAPAAPPVRPFVAAPPPSPLVAAPPVRPFVAAPPPSPVVAASPSPPPVAYVRFATQVQRPAPPPVPLFWSRPRTAIDAASAAARFFGPNDTLNVAGRVIRSPLTYASVHASVDGDASTVVTSLPVGEASRAGPLPYWPRYESADADQRARYLDWMMTGRSDPDVATGYVFLFFYGLERRVLLDGADDELARAEVRRLLGVYGGHPSFRRYASDFLAFLPLRRADRLLQMTPSEVSGHFRALLGDSVTGLAALLAWHHAHRRPLAAEDAARVAQGMEGAKRGVVVTRSAAELLDLFAIRYRDSFGEGIVLEAAKRSLTIEYHPASPSLLERRRLFTASVPNVLGRSAQFRKVVRLWNDCVDDLRKANARKRGSKELDAAAWSALPAELRAEYDHPDQDTWDAAIAEAPLLAEFHLLKAERLAQLCGLEGGGKLTAAQMKKIAARAADVGYAIEPEARLRSKSADGDTDVLIWRTTRTELPDAKVYGAVFAILSLAMTVALADGTFSEEERGVVDAFVSELFVLDEGMRTRVEAMKQLMARDPSKLGAVAKTLRETRTTQERATIAGVLVAIAAADGTIAETEDKALRALYRSLGLPVSELAGAIARAGVRLEKDTVIEVQAKAAGSGGVPIPRSDAPQRLELDPAVIAAIVADTRDVAAILAEVFDGTEDDEPESVPASSTADAGMAAPLAPAPRAADATAKLAAGLDVRYHVALEELLAKSRWADNEVRTLAARHRMMPGAIFDAINAWSDETLGDFLIEDGDGWRVNLELVKAAA